MKTWIVLGLWASISLFAAQQPRSFEVTSVRRSRENQYVPAVVDPERFRIVTTLAGAILWANDIVDRNYKLSGGPQWIHRDYYQIEGKAQAPATKKDMQRMLQSLLADRFKLKLHRESREMPVYALLPGNSGSKLPTSTEPCGEDGCIGVAPGDFFAKSAKMEDIAATLSNMLDRPVLDQTGLRERYDIRMRFDPSSTKLYESATTGRPRSDAPSIFVAVQNLGLRLEARRAAVEILIIDSASEPGN